MPTINIADKATLDTINSKIDIVDGVVDNIYSKVDTEIATLTTNLATVDTVADNIYAKVDTEVAAIKTVVDTINTNVTTVDGVVDNIYAKVDAEVASIVSATAANSTANKTGTLSQKDAYIISLLENATYGLNAIKNASSSSNSVIKSIQRGIISTSSSTGIGTATITSVNTSKAIVLYTGSAHSVSGYQDSQYSKVFLPSLVLTNSTTVTAQVMYPISAINVPYQVVEFY